MDQTTPSIRATPVARDAAEPSRRSFFYRLITMALGAVLALIPLVVGMAVLLDPTRRKSKANWVRLTTLAGVPDDGMPRLFPVITDRIDAWNYYPPEPIGGVYLVRSPGNSTPVAFTATCPHAGCFVGYRSGDEQFECPCHTSKFRFDGARVGGDQSVSPRDLDKLEVEVRSAPDGAGELTEVWVKFRRFQTGKHEQIPVA